MKFLLNIILFSILLCGCAREWDEPLLIAYDDANNIFIMDEDGKNVRQMTTAGSSTHPSFSPDGEYLVYRRGTTFYLINIETKQEKVLTTDPGLFPYSTWAPDGSKIAFIKNNRLYIMNIDGTIDPEISTVNTNQGPITWSSDSKTIACTNNGTGEVYYFNVSDHVRTAKVIIAGTGLSFSPDNLEIAYNNGIDFYISKTDFSSPRILTSASDTNPSWSPDGKQLVYESSAGEIRIINAAGGTYTQISGPGCHNPCFQCKPH